MFYGIISKRVIKLYFSLLIEAKFGPKGYAMILFYVLSLEKPELTQYAKELSTFTSKDDCFYTACMAAAWYLTMDYTDPSNEELNKVIIFIRDNCKRNGWEMVQWLKLQSKV